MNEERYETMTDEQLQLQAASLQRERNGMMTEVEAARGRVSKVNTKLEAILSEIGKRNYANMIQHFELTHDHLRLLREVGSDPSDNTLSDLQISELLGWAVSDDGLTERQETNIARLLAELKYAQDYVNKYADGLVGLNKSDGAQS